jgi:deoxyhypusine synthase
MKRYRPVSLKNVRRYSLKERKSKVELSQIAGVLKGGTSLQEFINSLPDILAARDFKEIVKAIAEARRSGRPVILGMGAHPIKVGLSPLIIDLMEQGIITAIATHGATVVHDFELSYLGHTSEDVASELVDGTFGMAKETGAMINRAIRKGAEKGMGIGSAIGKFIAEGRQFPNKKMSIFAGAYRLSVPITVHVAIGTDIVHMHPEACGEAIGKASLTDFRILTSVIADLEGGVFINLGSAVIIPEVFLKAINLARNLGNRIENITTVTMDFNRHYRPMTNVVHRPTQSGGRGFYLTGHHEIMFPLLAAALKEVL